MDDDVKLIEIIFANRRDMFDRQEVFSDVKDVVEKRAILDYYTMRKKIPTGKQNATVVYMKEYGRDYLFKVYGKTRKVIERALLNLN